MKKLSLLLFPIYLSAQVLTYSPQDRDTIPGLKGDTTCWAVAVQGQPNQTISGPRVLQIAVEHGLRPQGLSRSLEILNVSRKRSFWSLSLEIVTGTSAATAIATAIKTGGNFVDDVTATRIISISGGVALLGTIIRPYIQAQQPAEPAVQEHLLTISQTLSQTGSGEWFFFAVRTQSEQGFSVNMEK